MSYYQLLSSDYTEGKIKHVSSASESSQNRCFVILLFHWLTKNLTYNPSSFLKDFYTSVFNVCYLKFILNVTFLLKKNPKPKL